MGILSALLTVFLVLLFVRMIFSWIPQNPDSGLAPISRIVYDLTEPVLAPVRRVVPPVGMFDLSFLVVFIIVSLLRAYVAGL
jgi:YggT family protein